MRKEPLSIGNVWATRIAIQVSPIGFGNICLDAAPPGDGLAPRGKKRTNALCHRVVPILRNELRVCIERISEQRDKVSIAGAQASHGPHSHPCRTLGRIGSLWRAGTAFEEFEIFLDFGGMPRHLRPLSQFIDPQPHTVKQICRRKPALSDHLGERDCVRAVCSRAIGRNGVWCCVERNQHIGFRLDQSETTGWRRSR